MAEKSLLDRFFDGADQVMDGVEKTAGYKEGVWKIDDIIDNDTGMEAFVVTDGRKFFSTTNREDAEWLRGVLGK